MTMKEYLLENIDKAAYTIKKGRKSYLCRWEEAMLYFGNAEIKKVSNKYGNENLPLLHLA